MAVNDIIKKADYNSIRAKVVPILGASAGGQLGYGQTVQSSAVTESNRVTINEWAALRYDLINAYVHQNGSQPSIVQVAEGNTVRYDPTTAPVTQFDTIADSIVTNKLVTPPGSQSITTNKGTASTVWPGVFGNSWTSKISTTVSVLFSQASAARHFFNTGGEIRFTSSQSGGTTRAQTTSWASILTAAGTQAFGGNKPGTDVEPNDGQNFYRLSSTYATWYSRYGSTPYGSNYYKIEARTPAVADNSSGSANLIEFRISWIDDHVSLGGSPEDYVDGTFSLNVTTLEAYGTLVPAAAGNFIVESPSVTIQQIAPDGVQTTPVPVPPVVPVTPLSVTATISPANENYSANYGAGTSAPSGYHRVYFSATGGSYSITSFSAQQGTGLSYSIDFTGISGSPAEFTGPYTVSGSNSKYFDIQVYYNATGNSSLTFGISGASNVSQLVYGFSVASITAAPPPTLSDPGIRIVAPSSINQDQQVTVYSTSSSNGATTWNSSNSTILSVYSPTGSLTTSSILVTGGLTGTARISVAQIATGNYTSGSAFIDITVNAGGAPNLLISTSPPTMAVGGQAAISYTSRSTGAVTYTSSNSGIASISGSTVTGISAGTAIITGTQVATGTYTSATATVDITITPSLSSPGLSISISPSTFNVNSNSTVTATTNSPGSIVYSSSNTSVVVVGASTGALTGVSVGTATITAAQYASGTYTSATATANVTITAPAPVVTYNESISGPSQVYINQTFDITLTGGAPNTTATYSGLTTGTVTLNSTGTYTFTNNQLPSAQTQTWSVTFNSTGHVRSYTVTAVAAAAPSFTGFSLSPSTISAGGTGPGGTITVSWSTSNAAAVAIGDNNGTPQTNLAPSGTTSFDVPSSRAAGTYTVTGSASGSSTYNNAGQSGSTSATYTVTAPVVYDESVYFSPTETNTNVPVDGYVTGGKPNTGFSFTGSTSGSGTLDGSGNYIFAGLVFTSAGTYRWTFTFAYTGHTRTVSIVVKSGVLN